MTTLQKFKLLATQCAVVGSPARSPTTSPVVHLRRRKTLRMLLNRTDRRRFHRRDGSPKSHGPHDDDEIPPENSTDFRVRHKLRDLFVSSPPPPPPLNDGTSRRAVEVHERLLGEAGSPIVGRGFVARRGGSASGGSTRPLSAAFRYRLLLRRAWRPVLVAIPE